MRKHVRELLARRDRDGIVALAGEKRRVLGLLTSLTFDPDPLISWRAVEAMGLAAARIAEDDPESVRDHMRRLLWLLSDESGGVCSRAPEAMVEIILRKPDLLAEYIPIVVSLMVNMAEEDLQPFKPGMLWAIGRLGDQCGAHIQAVLCAITSALDDDDPQVRGMAVWCLRQVGQESLLAGRPELASDTGPVDVFTSGQVTRTRVCDLLSQVSPER